MEDADLAATIWIYSGGYAVCRQGNQRPSPRMHRVILQRMIGRPLEGDEQPDHIDGDPLNNRRNNLRLASRSANAANKGPQANNASGFKGVAWHKHRRRWTAAIQCNGKTYRLGYFDTPEEAARAYDKAAVELFGEFAKTNAMMGVL